MLPFRLNYSDRYDLHLGSHVFPSQKYRLIRDSMIKEGFASPGDFFEPPPATDEDMMLVHDRAWIDKLQEGTLSIHELMKLEVPYSHQMIQAFWLMTGGSIQASRDALERGIGFSIGGGFHHAFAGHGEGFCAVHDVAVAVRRMQKDKAIQTALIVDTDVHQGNGTAAIFANDPTVLTISIHQFNNYPTEKPPSTIDIHLQDGVSDDEYNQRLRAAYETAVEAFKPDLIHHVSGADPFMEDQLGGLLLTFNGLFERDRIIYEIARRYRIPVAVTLAGGYSFNVMDTVTVHINTAKAAAQVFGPSTNPA